MGRASKKQQKESSEEEKPQSEEQEFDEDDEDAILEAHPEDQFDEAQRDAALLEQIKEVAEKAEEGEQLTWNAIYSLKKEEGELSAKMNQEIEAIREKYELLKQPIFQQISNAALGNKLDNKIYRPEGLPCRGDPNKIAPKPIPDFWGVVFEKEGLISSEIDVECFSKVKELSCQLLDHKSNHIRVLFRFSSATNYFTNLELQVETRLDLENNAPVREIKQEIKYKTGAARQEASVFTMLFDSKTEVHETYSFASEFYQDYSNALYFYFKEDEEFEDGEDDGEENEAEGEEGDEEDDDEQSEEVQAVQKKQGKKKAKQEKKEKKQLEKPECKQQ